MLRSFSSRRARRSTLGAPLHAIRGGTEAPMRVAMRTLLLRVAEAHDGWPISLHVDDGSDAWLGNPVAADVIARAFPPAPVDVPSARTPEEAIRSFVLSQDAESDGFGRIGTYLHDLLRPGLVGTRWDEIVNEARRDGVGTRLLLDMPAALASLPWELMRAGLNWHATNVEAPIGRAGRGFPGVAELPRVRWPLRVLVVVGSPVGDTIVEAEEELRNLNDAFRRMCGQVDVEFLPQPSRQELRETYRTLRPHIFHFVGHGGVEADDGRLVLHDPESGQNKPWTTTEITMDLRGWQPRVAILNACRSTSVEEQEGAWRVADAFAAFGASAIIAMQADIRGDAAAAFTGDFYKALVRHDPLDVAVTEGRIAVTRVTGTERRDFALPSLTVSAPPASVLRMCFGVSDKYRTPVERLHRNFAGFVDRTHERRRLWHQVDPSPDEPDPAVQTADAIAIVGGTEVGKSELARWCIGACELHGGNAAYVKLDRGRRLACLRTLEIIAHALGASTVHGEHNRRAFEQFSSWTERLNRAGAGDGEPPPPADALDNAFVYFGDGLRDAADGEPLLIALDDVVGALPEEDLRFLCEFLLEPIALHKLAPVRLILVLSEDQREQISDALERAMETPIVLTSFKPEEFVYIAGQYLRYHFNAPPTVVDDKLRELGIKTDFTWQDLKVLDRLGQLWEWDRFA